MCLYDNFGHNKQWCFPYIFIYLNFIISIGNWIEGFAHTM